MAKKKSEPTFTEQIRRLIEDSGETRYVIAKDCGIDHAVMSRFMAGKSGLSMQSLDALAARLGWTVTADRKLGTKGSK